MLSPGPPRVPLPYKQTITVAAADLGKYQHLVNKLSKEFKGVITDNISEQPMAGPPMSINVKPDAKPTRRLTARTTPQAMNRDTNAQIK